MKNLFLLILCTLFMNNVFANETKIKHNSLFALNPANAANPLDFVGVKHNEGMDYLFDNYTLWYKNGKASVEDLVKVNSQFINSSAFTRSLPGVSLEGTTAELHGNCIKILNIKDLIDYLTGNGANSQQISWAREMMAVIGRTKTESDLGKALGDLKLIEKNIMSPAVKATLATLAKNNFKFSTLKNHKIEIALLMGASVSRYSMYYTTVEMKQAKSSFSVFVANVNNSGARLNASQVGPADIGKTDGKSAIIGGLFFGLGGALGGAVVGSTNRLLEEVGFWDWVWG